MREFAVTHRQSHLVQKQETSNMAEPHGTRYSPVRSNLSPKHNNTRRKRPPPVNTSSKQFIRGSSATSPLTSPGLPFSFENTSFVPRILNSPVTELSQNFQGAALTLEERRSWNASPLGTIVSPLQTEFSETHNELLTPQPDHPKDITAAKRAMKFELEDNSPPGKWPYSRPSSRQSSPLVRKDHGALAKPLFHSDEDGTEEESDICSVEMLLSVEEGEDDDVVLEPSAPAPLRKSVSFQPVPTTIRATTTPLDINATRMQGRGAMFGTANNSSFTSCRPATSPAKNPPRNKRQRTKSTTSCVFSPISRTLQRSRSAVPFSEQPKDEVQVMAWWDEDSPLPTVRNAHHDLKSISSQTLVDLFEGIYNDHFANVIVIDCRYPYEFEAGHITGAKNIYTTEGIEEAFFSENPIVQPEMRAKTAFIFHCEFSSMRGPALCRHMRKLDRQRCEYPHLDFPDLFLLNKGYKEFFEQFQKFCNPVGYTRMEADPQELAKYQHLLHRLKQGHKSKKLTSKKKPVH